MQMSDNQSRAVPMEPVVEESDHQGSDVSSSASLCFSLVDGRVTSLVSTPDGAYCFAGFSSGAVRLFDLTVGGVTCPEDRLGNLMGRIDAASNSCGALKVHLQIGGWGSGGADGGVNDLSVPKNVCHLFAGAWLGSSTMLVVDIASLRETKAKRGFITMAGGGVQVFKHSDTRLKGFTALSTLLVSSSGDGGARVDAEYLAKYRLVTGRGFCSYHIWEVVLEAAVGPSGALEYRDHWSFVASGSVNGPTMVFAQFVSQSRRPSSQGGAHQFFPAPTTQSGKFLLCDVMSGGELLTGTMDKDVRSVQLSPLLLEGGSEEPAAVQGRRDQPAHPLIDNLQISKPVAVKALTDVLVASECGQVLFGGKDQLVVTTYSPLAGAGSAAAVRASGAVSKRATFALHDCEGADRRTSRHLRVLDQVSCTSDGAYAVVLCSDNTVYLYR